MGQGIANIVVGIFGGMPTTGVIARTATSVRSGAKTPVAGMIHSLVLLVILLVAAPLAKHIPMAALSGVLVVVAIRMGEWHEFKRLTKWPRSDAAVFLCAWRGVAFDKTASPLPNTSQRVKRAYGLLIET